MPVCKTSQVNHFHTPEFCIFLVAFVSCSNEVTLFTHLIVKKSKVKHDHSQQQGLSRPTNINLISLIHEGVCKPSMVCSCKQKGL